VNRRTSEIVRTGINVRWQDEIAPIDAIHEVASNHDAVAVAARIVARSQVDSSKRFPKIGQHVIISALSESKL